MRLSMVGVVGAAVLLACAETPVESRPLPGWLATLIHQFEDPSVTNPPPFIARYSYQGRVVYYVAPRCCDIPSTLYSEAGVVLCAPDGGLTGSGDGRCPDFIAQRKDELIVWRAPGSD